MRLVKAVKASPHAKFYNLSTAYKTKRYKPPEFKFNSLFNELFPKLIFFISILSRKNWRGGGGLLFKNGKINGYAY